MQPHPVTGKFNTTAFTAEAGWPEARAQQEKVQVARAPFPSDVISIVMRRCRKFDVEMRSLSLSNNRTVEACDIYLPDDRFPSTACRIVVSRVR
ncbi:uncharacterized protein N7518_007674 [Penicillium psychrosexuale]|uniref:uncharacterized protein n=1 Tax=Penicillium psychrosexuale TaxID=1002107 RepID=UPI002545B3AB|nr:uncharacterized protein N7518_007674 [Penicillium psychrosexuale]KAJ5790663.1 hypothetical protein N7518_007674 [Penicillium psychrosexuale]